jgi:single-strand DNA-binding protein
MPSYNHVALMGNLTRDPELRYIPSGSAVCEFSIAVNRKWKGKDDQKKEEVSFFDIVAWGRTAEVAAEYLKKGRAVFVAGRLQQDRWDDAKTGQKRSKIRIVCEQIQFLGEKNGAGAPEEGGEGEAKADDDVPF